MPWGRTVAGPGAGADTDRPVPIRDLEIVALIPFGFPFRFLLGPPREPRNRRLLLFLSANARHLSSPHRATRTSVAPASRGSPRNDRLRSRRSPRAVFPPDRLARTRVAVSVATAR